MIRTFACHRTRDLFNGIRVRRWINIEGPARRKLEYLNAACTLGDLRVPSGNRLEALQGNRKGQYSIRINDQFRICFAWDNGEAYQVEIIDYH